MMAASQKHIPIKTWLSAVSLPQYESLFSHYKGVEDIVHWREAELKEVGIKNSAHRAHMVSSLVVLRAKLKQPLNKTSKPPLTKSQISAPILPMPPSGAQHAPGPVQLHSYEVQQQQYEPLHGAYGLLGRSTPDYQLHNQNQISKQLWYHGAIPRLKAEPLLKHDGDFLVRDSSSQKGDFVLTCQWKGNPIHFVVNRQTVMDPKTGIVKNQYQFEDKLCDTVPQLVHLYVNERMLISDASGARIAQPVNRRVSADSLSQTSSPFSDRHLSNVDNHNSSGFSPSARITQSKRAGSQPLLDEMVRDNPIMSCQIVHTTQQSSPKSNLQKLNQKAQVYHHARSDSEPVLIGPDLISSNEPVQVPGAKLKRNVFSSSHSKLSTEEKDMKCNGNTDKRAPPKPSRIPTVKLSKTDARPKVHIRNKQLYEDDGKDYSDYEQVKAASRNDVFTENPRLANVRASNASSGSSHDSGYHADSLVRVDDYDVVAEAITPRPTFLVQPNTNPPSKFDMTSYMSQILTPSNKPLESSAMATIKPLLLETEPNVLALHLSILDLDLLQVFAMNELGAGVYSGLELITLPQGKQMRADALERFHCLRLFVVSSILCCTAYQQRARMLHQWIQVAVEIRGTLGNFYGFAYIMEGLQSAQIERLRNTWISLKQRFAKSVQTYRSKLCSMYKSLRIASSALPLHNVTIPYIIPLLEILERQSSEDKTSSIWEDADNPMELDVMLSHLDIARIITHQYQLYKSTSIEIVGNLRPIRDVLELCDTRMHLRLLWGHRGCVVKAAERYDKFEQVLRAMSLKCEPATSSLDRESSL